ncbi:PREDICTED: putative disease resistance protein At4g11170 isoform X1 [Camelina sativa]|uniref:Disease resistance protein At4g11170 isoform X1 n=1 Tax=Camelina sativa TaxID=90675 RepID=A0ABM0XYD3_CAMSA|nr:PREDICTED: putative disease resistance protein At4g11170 isoform X1 [Camelina sativa]
MSASSSSSLLAPSQRSYDVFPSFSGQDVRRNFLSHLLGEFNRKGINTFVDNQIRRTESIGPELVQAIRASRIGIVILTKNYASSRWCLDELLEIMECRTTTGLKVMPIFYEMNPSDVRRQHGDFGEAFERNCVGKTEEHKQKWRQALTDVANIGGEHSNNWDSEAAMILKIATDITNILNFTPSRDFDHLVGMEAHIAKMNSLLCMESNEVRVVGIWGPAGIGKTTIARALYGRLSGDFQLSVFMENVKGNYNRNDSYSSKLQLQEQFLSEMLNLKDMRINHLGVAEERLNSQKVFIVLDDVDKLEQLEALANEPRWFGAGSRIIVTTEHKDLFKGHGINHIYEVSFPSGNEALQIFSRSAFKQDYPPEGFMELAVGVTEVTNRLPLGLCVLGSSLRGKSKCEWTRELPSLKSSLHGDIEKVLRVGYDSLGDDDKYKTMFLHIACLFDGEGEDRAIQLLENSTLDIKYGLGVLVDRALINISSNKRITMHHLLRQMGREIVRRQSAHEPGKRQFLIDAQEIYDVLSDNTGTESVLGISFNMSEIRELLFLGERAFSGMHNLQILRFYKLWSDKARVHLHEGLDCLPLPRKLKLLHWEGCPMKHMSFRFRPECLIEINMKWSNLKKLWEGVPMLRSLKKIELSGSTSLEELPDLSEALNLEHLDMQNCHSLVKLPSSIWKLSRLTFLHLYGCRNLEPLPANYALDSLSYLNIGECSKNVAFPEISSEIKKLSVSFTPIPAVPPSVEHWSCLRTLEMIGCGNVTEFPRVPYTVSKLHLHLSGIKEIPPWISDLYGLKELSMAFCTELREISPNICELGQLRSLNFKGCYNVREFPAEIFQSFCIWHELELTLANIGENSLPTYTPEKTEDFPLRLYMSENDFVSIPDSVVQQVKFLHIRDCRELESLPELPGSLSQLYADNCVSLERLSQSSRSSHDPKLILKFINCSELDQESRKLVIQQWACGYAVLPGSEMPDYFTHQARRSSLTIPFSQGNSYGSLRFKACVVLPPRDEFDDGTFRRFQISCYVRGRHSTTVYKWPEIDVDDSEDRLLENHLFILNSYFTLEEDNIPKSEMLFDFRCLGMKEYPDTIFSNILGCGVQLLEPCSCGYDSDAHPELSTTSLEEEVECNNNSVAETRGSNKRERCSVVEGLERTSKYRRITN